MQLKPKFTSFKTWRGTMAVGMALYGGLIWFLGHNRHDGLWALGVSLALLLGLWTDWPGRLRPAKKPEIDPASKLQLS
jgi:hypothetical protein